MLLYLTKYKNKFVLLFHLPEVATRMHSTNFFVLEKKTDIHNTLFKDTAVIEILSMINVCY